MVKLNKKWTSYLEQVVPTTASDIQVIETKRAFYAGAFSMFNILTRETKTSEHIDELYNEIIAYITEEDNRETSAH